MRLRALLWWGLLLLLLPLLLPMALYSKRTALRLPVAAGAPQGLVGAADGLAPLRILLLGESTVAGVGVGQLEQALVGQLARSLAVRQGRPVSWRACGENGITAPQASERLLSQALAEPVDLAVLVFGVNDTTHFSSLRAWRQALERMTLALQAQGARVAFTSVPPLQHFAALPWLLRQVLGLRAAQLDRHLQAVACQLGALHCPVELEFAAEYLAEDGYHPSAQGYRVWAEGLALALSPPPRVAVA